MTQLSVFNFNESEVRTVIQEDGEIWFVAADIAKVLEYRNAPDMVRNLDDDEIGTTQIVRTSSGGNPNLTIISESGLYSATLKSRKPEAKQFKKWVTSDVLPSIRKNGGYIAGQEVDSPELIMAKALQVAQTVINRKSVELEQANAKIVEMQPEVDALCRIAKADGSLCLTDTAKALQMRPKDFISLLNQKQWIYKRTGSAHYVGYQDKVQSGYLEHKVTEVSRSDGSSKITEQVRVTPKGLTKLSRLLGNQQ